VDNNARTSGLRHLRPVNADAVRVIIRPVPPPQPSQIRAVFCYGVDNAQVNRLGTYEKTNHRMEMNGAMHLENLRTEKMWIAEIPKLELRM
jgi:hypothetical protein